MEDSLVQSLCLSVVVYPDDPSLNICDRDGKPTPPSLLASGFWLLDSEFWLLNSGIASSRRTGRLINPGAPGVSLRLAASSISQGPPHGFYPADAIYAASGPSLPDCHGIASITAREFGVSPR